MLNRKQLAELRRAKPAPSRLGLAMRLAGLTQVQVSEAIGCRQPSISRMKRYGSDNLKTARALARLFGCHVEDLFPLSRKEAA